MLNRDVILNNKDLKKEKVSVPEWGGDVFVSEMSGESRDAWEQSIIRKDKGDNMVNIRAKLVVATVTDESGTRLFAVDDVERVGQLSAKALERICKAAQKLNGLTDDDLEEAKGN